MNKGLTLSMVLTVLGVASGAILWAGNLQGDVRVNETRIENGENAIAELKSGQKEITNQMTDMKILIEVLVRDRGYNPDKLLATTTTYNKR